MRAWHTGVPQWPAKRALVSSAVVPVGEVLITRASG